MFDIFKYENVKELKELRKDHLIQRTRKERVKY